jgi:GGDEF domain-containing protein
VSTHHTTLDQVADEITAAVALPGSSDLLLIALRPDDFERRVVGTSGNSAIRAAVSVAIAAGNLRPWSDARSEALVDVDVAGLPEIVRSSVQPNGIRSIRVGIVGDGPSSDRPACMTMWLSVSSPMSVEAERRHLDVLGRLSAAVEADYERAAIEAAARLEADNSTASASVETPKVSLDELPDRAAFQAALEQLDSDETGLIVIALHHDGADVVDVDALAQHLVQRRRRGDLVARIDAETFAVLLPDTDRRTAFEQSRELRSIGGTSVGLAHEDGLVDPDELFESAMRALVEARRSGGDRMLVAC